jgi:hypothetical protein
MHAWGALGNMVADSRHNNLVSRIIASYRADTLTHTGMNIFDAAAMSLLNGNQECQFRVLSAMNQLIEHVKGLSKKFYRHDAMKALIEFAERDPPCWDYNAYDDEREKREQAEAAKRWKWRRLDGEKRHIVRRRAWDVYKPGKVRAYTWTIMNAVVTGCERELLADDKIIDMFCRCEGGGRGGGEASSEQRAKRAASSEQ